MYNSPLHSPERLRDIHSEIDTLKERWAPQKAQILTHSKIDIFDMSKSDFPALENLCFHYSLMNNGAAIENAGLIARIGKNSRNLDNKKAIYFSWGAESVFHNWDVWIKWRLNQLFNPGAAQSSFKLHDPKLSARVVGEWMNYMASKAYRKDTDKLNAAFEYEKVELTASYYYALDLFPGTDFDPYQIDPKKEYIQYIDYACEIYGAGVSTDVYNMRAERWNMSTKLGCDYQIPTNRIHHVTVGEKESALDVLIYIYRLYMSNCEKHGIKPADFAVLGDFVNYCAK